MVKKVKLNQEDKNKSLDFESALKNLESIITKMESGKLSLEESISSFETGVALTNHCRGMLENAQQKIQILISEQDKKFQDFNLADHEN
ncbi:MAG: exodeoxyribonuclease VII small subunit [Gammaproteobacteria bacterium]|nr:exodeoxyribonuclease VII small subunit [Gammaproteobacteria bacterium]